MYFSVDTQSHLYEEVKDLALYQDVPLSAPPPPFLDQRLPHQGNEWKPYTVPQVRKRHLHVIWCIIWNSQCSEFAFNMDTLHRVKEIYGEVQKLNKKSSNKEGHIIWLEGL